MSDTGSDREPSRQPIEEQINAHDLVDPRFIYKLNQPLRFITPYLTAFCYYYQRLTKDTLDVTTKEILIHKLAGLNVAMLKMVLPPPQVSIELMRELTDNPNNEEPGREFDRFYGQYSALIETTKKALNECDRLENISRTPTSNEITKDGWERGWPEFLIPGKTDEWDASQVLADDSKGSGGAELAQGQD